MNSQPKQMIAISLFIIATMLSACTTPTSASPTLAQQSTLPPTQAPTLAPSPTVLQSPSPTVTEAATSQPQTSGTVSLDPCKLLDSDEARQLTGVSFGSGVESSLASDVKVCTYGANTANVLMVEVGQSPDVDAAKAVQANFLSDIKEGLSQFGNVPIQVTEIPDFGSGAVSANFDLSAINVAGSAFAFRKDTTFFGFSDLVRGGQAPTPEVMRAEAASVLDKLP